MTPQRLQRVLAAAGFGSRRACEELILEGRVSVNGERVARLPVLVDPQRDEIAVDGRPVLAEKKVHFLLHKPKGVSALTATRWPNLAVDLLRGVRGASFRSAGWTRIRWGCC
ncbi:MAG: S4 domain-containing protein [Phycisphaerae bacterium]